MIEQTPLTAEEGRRIMLHLRQYLEGEPYVLIVRDTTNGMLTLSNISDGPHIAKILRIAAENVEKS